MVDKGWVNNGCLIAFLISRWQFTGIKRNNLNAKFLEKLKMSGNKDFD